MGLIAWLSEHQSIIVPTQPPLQRSRAAHQPTLTPGPAPVRITLKGSVVKKQKVWAAHPTPAFVVVVAMILHSLKARINAFVQQDGEELCVRQSTPQTTETCASQAVHVGPGKVAGAVILTLTSASPQDPAFLKSTHLPLAINPVLLCWQEL